jgi:hypothetical protein
MKPENLEKIFAALNEADVQYLIVGGMAVMAHGYVRMTRDLDLVIGLDGGNPEQALKVFERLGYRPNVPVELMEFADSAKRFEWKEQKGMQVFQIISEDLLDCPVDLFIEEPIAFSEMHAARVEYELGDDLWIPVVGLSHLKQLKRAAGRPRDLLDLEELERLSGADEGND